MKETVEKLLRKMHLLDRVYDGFEEIKTEFKKLLNTNESQAIDFLEEISGKYFSLEEEAKKVFKVQKLQDVENATKLECGLDWSILPEETFIHRFGITCDSLREYCNIQYKYVNNECLSEKINKEKILNFSITGEEEIFQSIKWLLELNRPEVLFFHLQRLRDHQIIEFNDDDIPDIMKLEKKILFNKQQKDLIILFEFWQKKNFIFNFEGEATQYSKRISDIFYYKDKDSNPEGIKNQYSKLFKNNKLESDTFMCALENIIKI